MTERPPTPAPSRAAALTPAVPTKAVVTTRDRQLQHEQEALAAESLASIRAVAGNWQKGMAGLVTLTTATMLFKGADTIADYERWVAVSIGLALLTSLVCGIGSLLWFLRAMHGTGEVVTDERVTQAGGLLGLRLQMSTAAVQDLERARPTALAGIAALVVAIALSWYGPTTENDPPAFVKVTYATPLGEVTRCGVLKAAGSENVVVQIKGEPAPRTIPTRDLAGIVVASSC